MIARAVACGSGSSPLAISSLRDEHRVLHADRDREAQLLLGLGRPDRQHGDVAAVRLDELDRLLDRALLVRARREREVPRVDRATVGGQRDLRAGRRARASHTTRMRNPVASRASALHARVVGIEQRP